MLNKQKSQHYDKFARSFREGYKNIHEKISVSIVQTVNYLEIKNGSVRNKPHCIFPFDRYGFDCVR